MNSNDKVEHMTIEQAEMASIFEKVPNISKPKEKTNEGEIPSELRTKAFEDFYGLKSEPPKSEIPPIIGGRNPLFTSYDNYVYRYKSGFLTDTSFCSLLETIMTEGMRATGKYIPIAEWQTFTRDGECIIAVKYLERIDKEQQANNDKNNNVSNKQEDSLAKELAVKDVLLHSLDKDVIIKDDK